MKRWQPLLALAILLLAILACRKATEEEIRGLPTKTPVVSISPTVLPTVSPTVLPTESLAITPTEALATVTAVKALNVRKLPTEHSPSIGNLLTGDIISLRVGNDGLPICTSGWVRIEFKGDSAWVNADYVSGSLCE